LKNAQSDQKGHYFKSLLKLYDKSSLAFIAWKRTAWTFCHEQTSFVFHWRKKKKMLFPNYI